MITKPKWYHITYIGLMRIYIIYFVLMGVSMYLMGLSEGTIYGIESAETYDWIPPRTTFEIADGFVVSNGTIHCFNR